MHILNILKDGELDQKSVVKDYLITAKDGKKFEAKKADDEDLQELEKLEQEIKDGQTKR